MSISYRLGLSVSCLKSWQYNSSLSWGWGSQREERRTNQKPRKKVCYYLLLLLRKCFKNSVKVWCMYMCMHACMHACACVCVRKRRKIELTAWGKKVPIPFDGILTCTSGIRAHRASDYTMRAGTPRVSRNKYFRHSPVRSIIKHNHAKKHSNSYLWDRDVCVCVCVCVRAYARVCVFVCGWQYIPCKHQKQKDRTSTFIDNLTDHPYMCNDW